MKVVHASVVLSWLLEEPGRAGAQASLEAHVAGNQVLVAPELLHYEIANALVRGARLPSDLARQAYANFEALAIETYSLGAPEYDAAIALAAERGLTVYDASYAVLAKALACRFVTADRKLARALEPLMMLELV